MNITDYIIENNHQFLVAHKFSGQPVVPDLTGDVNLKNMLEAYVKHDLFPITRIDRPVSGIVLFAAQQESAAYLSQSIRDQKIEKLYYAIVEGILDQDAGTLEHFLAKGRNNKAHESPKGKHCMLSYDVVKRFDKYTLLNIRTYTGRFHQIRSQLSLMGHPIKGDVKYGARRKNKDRSIHLHAYSMKFLHPVSKKMVAFKTPLPDTDTLWKVSQEAISK